MPQISVGAQIFDLAFHPSEQVVFTGLLTGHVKAFRYDEQGQHDKVFDLRPSKRSCRALATNEDGSLLYAVGRGKGMHTIDTNSGTVTESRLGIHEAAINRVKKIMPNLLVTGDDDGVVKLWDPRKQDAVRAYTHHYDFISDFMWIEGKRHLVATSGDGTLSVVDVRSSKTQPFAHSEDQEDELLSLVPIRGGLKTVVGTQLGVLTIFNKNSGWGDCVDRVPGHPQSIDALCNLPSSMPSSHSTILTGSSDGLLRAVQLLPTKLIGVIADHGDFPIERIAIDRDGEGHWVGSVGHDELLRLTDLKDIFEDEVDDEKEGEENEDEDEEENEKSNESDADAEDVPVEVETREDADHEENDQKSGGEAEEVNSDEPTPKNKRKKRDLDPLAKDMKDKKRKKREAFTESDPSFFSGF